MNVVGSVTRWGIMLLILAIYNNETLSNCIHYFVKEGSKFCPTLNKPSKNCQSLLKFCRSCKFSLNLVTLVVVVVVGDGRELADAYPVHLS